MTDPAYETSDVDLASFILSQRAMLLGYNRPSPRRAVFRFRADERLHELLRLRGGVVPPVHVGSAVCAGTLTAFQAALTLL